MRVGRKIEHHEDYRDLLLTYLAHVGICEKINFVDPDDRFPVFTFDQFADLRKLPKYSNEMELGGT